MKRVSVRLVPIETRSFESDDFFIWLHHVKPVVFQPVCRFNQMHITRIAFFKNSFIEALFRCDQISKPNFSNLVSIYFT